MPLVRVQWARVTLVGAIKIEYSIFGGSGREDFGLGILGGWFDSGLLLNTKNWTEKKVILGPF